MILTQIEMEPSGIPHDIKRRNLRNLMLFLLSCGKMTKSELLQRTDLSTTTVSDAINSLQAVGIIRKTGTQKSTGGRQPSVYAINNDYGTFLGIRIEQDHLFVAGTDMYARPVYRREVFVGDTRTPLYALYNAVEKAAAALPKPVLALGLGMSGKLNFKNGVVLSSETLKWRNVPIKEILERRYKILTVLDSKINQGTIYQQVLGSAKHIANFACYFSEMSDRVAFVADGHLYYGDDNEYISLGNDKPLERLKLLISLLNIHVVITDIGDSLAGVCQMPLTLDDGYFETAAALTAEIAWFGSVYSIQTKKQR